MASKAKQSTTELRRPDRKWGALHGGVGVAVWLNEVETEGRLVLFLSDDRHSLVQRPQVRQLEGCQVSAFDGHSCSDAWIGGRAVLI